MNTLYWTGGEGSLQDPNHYSLTSGGTGGAGLPTSTTDIIFDDNSGIGHFHFYTDEDVECNNLINTGISNTPDGHLQNGASINIYGNYDVLGRLRFADEDEPGFINIRGNGVKIIKSPNATIQATLQISGGGVYDLHSILATRELYLSNNSRINPNGFHTIVYGNLIG